MIDPDRSSVGRVVKYEQYANYQICLHAFWEKTRPGLGRQSGPLQEFWDLKRKEYYSSLNCNMLGWCLCLLYFSMQHAWLFKHISCKDDGQRMRRR